MALEDTILANIIGRIRLPKKKDPEVTVDENIFHQLPKVSISKTIQRNDGFSAEVYSISIRDYRLPSAIAAAKTMLKELGANK